MARKRLCDLGFLNGAIKSRSFTDVLANSPSNADDVVLYKHGEKSAEVLRSSAFRNVTFKTYNGLGHYTVPEEMDDVCKWLTARLGLDGTR